MTHSGVLVASDHKQEWLLPWFYRHFRTHHADCPLAFADFGMSLGGRAWCQDRGILVDVPEMPSLQQVEVQFHGEFWQERDLNTLHFQSERWVTFRKPFAIAASPFEKTLWLDLDCQVRGDLSSLFALPLASGYLGASLAGSTCSIRNISTGHLFLVDKYNSGIILTEKGAPLLEAWVSLTQQGIAFATEEVVLSFLASIGHLEITNIPHLYNWPFPHWGENESALIYHWLGSRGKALLLELV